MTNFLKDISLKCSKISEIKYISNKFFEKFNDKNIEKIFEIFKFF